MSERARAHGLATGRAADEGLWWCERRWRVSSLGARSGIAGIGGGGRGVELATDGGKPLAQAGAEEAIVAHLDEAPGQDVLEEAADELLGRQGAGSERAGVGGAVAEGDPVMLDFQDAPVADGDAEDVGGEILEGVTRPLLGTR